MLITVNPWSRQRARFLTFSADSTLSICLKVRRLVSARWREKEAKTWRSSKSSKNDRLSFGIYDVDSTCRREFIEWSVRIVVVDSTMLNMQIAL